MKMNGQSRSFVKQVQADLLALDDTDLFNIVAQWINDSHTSGEVLDVPEETRLALGYTRAFPDIGPLADPPFKALDADYEASAQWHAPSPHHLRTRLSAMDASVFAQHVITFAYRSLHPIHPEWYDGVTFNAHLANYLRRMRSDAANHEAKARQR